MQNVKKESKNYLSHDERISHTILKEKKIEIFTQEITIEKTIKSIKLTRYQFTCKEMSMYITAIKYFTKNNNLIMIPVTCGTKLPRIKNWSEVTETPIDMFKADDNYGLLTGKRNNITVIDIDIYKNKEYSKKFIEKYKDIFNDTLMMETPRYGLHIVFEYELKLKTTHGLKGYIDIQNDGAQIIMPPSYIDQYKNGYIIKNYKKIIKKFLHINNLVLISY